MSPKRDNPPVEASNGSVYDHVLLAYKHLTAAIALLSAGFRARVTSRPPLKLIWKGLVGRRRKPSVLAVISVPISAGIVGLVVAVTFGYPQVEQLVIGDTESLTQWVGGLLGASDPHSTALVGLLVFVVAAGGFAACNSGLLPTIAVVMGPIVGIGLSRYGMVIQHFSPSKLHRFFGITPMHFETVGPLEALGTALFLAFVWGIPIGILGFAIGTLSRRFKGLLGRRQPESGTAG